LRAKEARKYPSPGVDEVRGWTVFWDGADDFRQALVPEQVVGAIVRFCRVGQIMPISRHDVPPIAICVFLTRYAYSKFYSIREHAVLL
jgi:hypothetical protein